MITIIHAILSHIQPYVLSESSPSKWNELNSMATQMDGLPLVSSSFHSALTATLQISISMHSGITVVVVEDCIVVSHTASTSTPRHGDDYFYFKARQQKAVSSPHLKRRSDHSQLSVPAPKSIRIGEAKAASVVVPRVRDEDVIAPNPSVASMLGFCAASFKDSNYKFCS